MRGRKADDMAKKKLIEDIKINPARFYRMPADVSRDRRFSDEERLEILDAWERDLRTKAETGNEEEYNPLKQVMETRLELERKRSEQNDRGTGKSGSGN
jgi:hypothetical protein